VCAEAPSLAASPVSSGLGLRAGDWVEVRSAAEILATLDERGRLEARPFMPEMLSACGKRFRVFKSAHKGCDTIATNTSRRMDDAVHLEGLRCDGGSHGGCQARCMIYWKDAWLKRVDGPAAPGPAGAGGPAATERGLDLERLTRATRHTDAAGEEIYSCQATTLPEATVPLHPWDPRQYVKDLTSRNVPWFDLVRYLILAGYNAVMRLHWRGRPYPRLEPRADVKTPHQVLNLQPGELVQVRSKDEIMETINRHHRNRGLSFDVEMLPFCGRTFRVLARIDMIIDERSGRMMRMNNPCVVLEGVICGGNYSTNRLFCPRSIYPYWREIWLKRVETA
jgi:hypothetical protein